VLYKYNNLYTNEVINKLFDEFIIYLKNLKSEISTSKQEINNDIFDFLIPEYSKNKFSKKAIEPDKEYIKSNISI